MVAWMLYVTAAGCAFGVAALLAERGLRELGRPVRWAWLGAMAATVAVPVVLAWIGWGGGGGVGAGGQTASSVGPSLETVLMAVWLVASLILLASVRLSGWTVRRNRRSWRPRRVDGQRVAISTGFGPGVVGAARPRIVLPGWVVDATPTLRRLVVAHEREHVRGGDTRVLLTGLAMAILVPWCLPLWWQLHRLRWAVETDCDVRVLATAPPRAYANALVAIAGRSRRGPLAVPGLAPRRSELERRIRLITGHGVRSRPNGLGLLAAAAVMMVPLALAPAPELPGPGFDMEFTLAGQPAIELPREATVILTVTRGAP